VIRGNVAVGSAGFGGDDAPNRPGPAKVCGATIHYVGVVASAPMGCSNWPMGMCRVCPPFRTERETPTMTATYIEWCDRTAALVRETYADTIIIGEDIRNGFVDFLDEPRIDFEEGVSPEQAAAEICRRIGLVNQLRS
jgi:hypothetical protein